MRRKADNMISFDLDMTLLDHRTGEITPSALKAIEQLRGRHKIVIATGRDMDNYYSVSYRDRIKPDAIVHLNGTKVTAEGRLLFEHSLDRGLVKRLLSFCEQEGLAIGLTLGDEDYFIHPEIVEESDKKYWGRSGRRFRDPCRMLEQNIHTLAYVGDADGARRVEAAFPALRLPMFEGGRGADVIERGFSKAGGLRRVAEYFNEAPDLSQTVAFGDGLNDMEMIMAAGTGIAMGNGAGALKQSADYVTAPIDEDGVYQALLHLGLLREKLL